MKKGIKTIVSTILFLSLITATATMVSAKKWVVKVSNDKFTPYNLTHVTAGDTIRWEWVEGVHTTTSTSIPAGADPWDAPITQTESAFVIRPNVNGTYFYTCTAHPGTMNGSFVVSGAYSTGDDLDVSRIHIFPNPFTDRITIETAGTGDRIRSLKLYSMEGKLVRSINYGTSSVPENLPVELNGLVPGVYTINITNNRSQQFSRRIICH